MDDKIIVGKINSYLFDAAKELAVWLERMLKRVTPNWWNECVINNLTSYQVDIVIQRKYDRLDQLDLSALLRITKNSWFSMQAISANLPNSKKECIKEMLRIRNRWAHAATAEFEKNDVLYDLDTILEFFRMVLGDDSHTEDIKDLEKALETDDFSGIGFETKNPVTAPEYQDDTDRSSGRISASSTGDPTEIHQGDMVYLVAQPETKGLVSGITDISGTRKYKVFSNNSMQVFYEDQIKKILPEQEDYWIDINKFRTNLTAFEINNPSAENLYSLNAARIDFVPYQFRPALKLIKSDEPRLLIADSVGVGKTIEAGLIIKELEARGTLETILIVCPKPLVAERKWELEMNRFDENFVPLNGSQLRQALSDAHRDEEWPPRYNKAIIPYSILDEVTYNGLQKKGHRKYGLLDLDPPPHFDLVIIDEAHHIRNGSMDHDKAFAYKCVRYFCEHATAVVMLTATPLQTRDNDLFTLLNLLRPDIVMDKEVFQTMADPNRHIYECSHIVRGAQNGWEERASNALQKIGSTSWGKNIIQPNPLYNDILNRLEKGNFTREARVKLVSDIESLHSFNMMLNRTRRKDIQDFCIRRSYTLQTAFTIPQARLHDALLQFEHDALSKLHSSHSVAFMMSTIKRQAASCIFGLVPHINDILARRLCQLNDDPDLDIDDAELSEKEGTIFNRLAAHVLSLAENLPDEDPKFESVLEIIQKKQTDENNKIMIFSSFRHTLGYLHRKIEEKGYRVAQIDGSVMDSTRQELRERFEMERENPDALDILLFTEVGSEGLDYQFCDTMINYDLPWNPMRIEQRIGRIDRRGQKSEIVHIYNVVTEGTVDADIYTRCLKRIGIFERSVGECEEVLGTIANKVEQIAINGRLTPKERREKLEQLADNEVRRMQSLSKLEDEERALFGFDLSSFTMANEINNAESPWLSPSELQRLVDTYLQHRLGPGEYIIGSSDTKQIRLRKECRLQLLEDLKKLPRVKNNQQRRWEQYLMEKEPSHRVTFLSEEAAKDRKAFFLTPMHPLVKQAAKALASTQPSLIHLIYFSDSLPKGRYPFEIYTWKYVGMQPAFKVVPICQDGVLSDKILDILQEAGSVLDPVQVKDDVWNILEKKHIDLRRQAKENYVKTVRENASYKLESLRNNFQNRKNILEQKIQNAIDVNICRMHSSELQTAEANYTLKADDIRSKSQKADILTTLITKGVIDIE